MHTFNGKTCRIHYNSDMSGEIVISGVTQAVEDDVNEVKIDIEDVIDFLAAAAREKALRELENKYGSKTGREILGL